jgi:hypothetical protein
MLEVENSINAQTITNIDAPFLIYMPATDKFLMKCWFFVILPKLPLLPLA